MDIDASELPSHEAGKVIAKLAQAFQGKFPQWLKHSGECRSEEARNIALKCMEVEVRDDHLLSQFVADCHVVGYNYAGIDNVVARVSGLASASPVAALAVMVHMKEALGRYVQVLEILSRKCSQKPQHGYLVEQGSSAGALSEALALESMQHPDAAAIVQRAEEVCDALLKEVFHVIRVPIL
ncbi:hypothetical protein [Piscinibacter terrae]|uniref:Uncharacterized protein n=1 Tax=Piscinibacter terrae TaxID=2496871 RepID=A0A3N7HRR8_9BURK|nr:hypothetical protein [Albitalea terrae]RQP23491.1 hypothetical protein DZC73_15155 [Albitalea terrae]